MDERPADAARRALRAAREQQTGPLDGPADRRRPGPDDPAGAGSRPGDAARDALRRAVSARRGDGTAEEGAADEGAGHGPSKAAEAAEDTETAKDTEGTEESEESEESAPRPAVPSSGAPADGAAPRRPAGARPSEAAREALRGALARRAARAERSGEDAAQAEPRTRDLSAASPPTSVLTANRATQDRGPVASHADGPPTPPAGPPDHTPQEAVPGAPFADVPWAGTGSPLVPDGPERLAPPRTPRTMASPRRDGELRRTFPAFPAREADAARFAETWWGNAWIDALEEGALDAARLARGREYAQTGHVDAVTVTPGLVLAYVQGSRPRPYRVQVRLRTLDDADWDRFLDAVAERPGHIAALLDKEMPQSLADCGVPLLPGPGDLEPHCSCPDRGHPCKHAAALCYQTARLLDADPFVLLLLRGRGERELLDALSRLNATRAARAAQEREPEPFPGMRAAEALVERHRPPLPAPLPPPPHPEQPPVYPAAPGGPDPFALDQLATDAAARAHAMLTTGRDPVGGLTLWQDAVRLAAARPGSGLTAATRALYASLAATTGRSTAELARAVAAWRQGGAEGLAVLEDPWDPPAGRFDRARPLLLAADLPAFRPWRNRLTHPRGHLQLRLGRDGLWYAYESEPDRDDWWPRGTPDLDPVGALTGLGAPGAL
ncbi:SWIM zinc finger family protein [Streptomyces sp. NPDC014889]|uniref:SWIM zinc finger family protein n=1 Tax=Streptomyces sp. NPDC014889 TaxID=3364928 RepID=UPI0036FC8F44